MKAGFIKDAFSGMPHVMAFLEHDDVKLKSITEFGKSIITDFNFNKKDISNTIPVGFIFTGFITESDSEKVETKINAKNDKLAYVSSQKNVILRSKINARDTNIKKFNSAIDKLNAISFKAEAFRHSTKKSEFLRRVNSGKVVFDECFAKIDINPKFAFSHVEKELISNTFGSGFIRKSADKDMMRGPKNRRVLRRARVLTDLSKESQPKSKNNISVRIENARKQVKNGR